VVSVVSVLPAAFIGHGSPMNALERNRYTESWRSLGASAASSGIAAVLVVSAHWYINATAVTAMAKPRTIHDFYGFPDELFAVEYPAAGAPEMASAVAEIAKPHWVGLDHDSWGLDHGAWSVLCHMLPAADVPVLQLSINAQRPFDYHLDLGRRLAPLREQGVLIVASGNVVHNLRRIDWSHPDDGFDWAHRFDDDARAAMTSAPADVVSLQGHHDFALAVPTPDHFLPLLYLAGLADAAGHPAGVLIDGYAMGSLSMTSYVLDAPPATAGGAAGAAAGTGMGSAALPDPSVVPPDDTNL
jgi:4,5-DOPA dioxygenase extradiol